ncbi:hypothetical protein [Isoptericola aurantiacus]|uniref:hypothetical protein n=1 Tax=Isoptericola aurantiacus TaxID=3377839 RepID=UPI00383A79A2
MTTPVTRAPHPSTTPRTLHEHGWAVESSHATSDGHVLYVRCSVCGARRVDLRPLERLVPTALSREVVSTCSADCADTPLYFA